jgi:hypothetical protein
VKDGRWHLIQMYHLVRTWDLADCIRILDVHSASFQQKQRITTHFIPRAIADWGLAKTRFVWNAQAAEHSDLRTCFRAKPSYKYSVPISLLIFLSFSPPIRINAQ